MTGRAACGVLLVSIIACIPTAPAQAQDGPEWRTVEISRQLHDTLPQRVRVQYGAGRVEIRGAPERLQYAVHLRYDQTRAAPLHRYEGSQHSTLLGLEPLTSARRATGRDDDRGELRVGLPRTVPVDLDLEFGGTQAVLDLGDLSLQSVRLDCGAADASLLFSKPNRVRMRTLDVNVGAADFSALHLANANAEQVRVQGGIGGIDLDFGGAWTHDLSVVARLAMGKLTLRVPADVGIRLDMLRVAADFEHEGLLKRDDGWYSANWDAAPFKLRVRAETFFGKIEVQHTAR